MNIQMSVVTLTKDRAILLKECLVSLANQTQKVEELVVVDNGSTDEARQVISGFQRRIPIRYLRSAGRGYPALYNVGIRAARGKWIVLLDDDCIASAGWLAAMKRAATRFPSALIQGKTMSIPKGNIYAEIMEDHYQNWIASNSMSHHRMRTCDNKNLCIPRATLKKLGAFDETLTHGSEDIELGARYHNAGTPIVYEPKALAYHHERTTLGGFVSQHARIAQSERLVGNRLSPGDRIRVIPMARVRLHIKAALIREKRYVLEGRFLDALLLPVVYALLACVRLYGYTLKSV